jgi:AcrR family transcriptional regulator
MFMKTKREISKPVRRQEERVALTREKILSSAKKIFTRDGYEAARLEEIAANAGYTRGAFYANYKNKEELFVAVARQQFDHHFSISLKTVQSASDAKSRIHELLQELGEMPEARTWMMLMIEFSLFTLRHPQRRKHLTSLNEQLLKDMETVFENLYRGTNSNLPFPFPIIGIGFYSLVQGLVLQEMLNGNLVTPKVTNDLLRFYLHALMGALP